MSQGERPGSRLRVLPVFTASLVAVSVALEFLPRAARALAFERSSIQSGELWRLVTGHLVHGSARLALFDLTALALFGIWLERVSRCLLLTVLAGSALVASAAVLLCTDYERYVGSSALVSGLLVSAAVLTLRSSRERTSRLIAWAMLVFFAGKVTLEFTGSWIAGLGGLPHGYETVAAAHLGGGLSGLAVVLARRRDVSGSDA